MQSILLEAQAVTLVSVFKPIVMTVFLGAWAWVVSNLDKDAAYFYLKRRLWNGVQMACGVTAFGLWLLIPIFWLGLPVALLILVGGVVGYVMYRNPHVPDAQRWTLSTETLKQFVAEREHEQAQKSAAVAFLDKQSVRMPVPSGEDPLVPVHEKLEAVLEFALPRGSERIDIAAGGQRAAIVVHVDGVKYPQPEVDPQLAVSLIDYLKQKAGLEVSERRKKQQGVMKVDAGAHGEHTLGLSTAGSSSEVNATVQVDPDKRFAANFDDIGLLDAQHEALVNGLVERHGVCIVACPPRHGMTTSLYSLMQRHDAYTQNVLTLEEDIAFAVEGSTQVAIEPGADTKWINDQLQRMLRQDPQVLMVGRVSDASTAQLLADSATETRVYVGMHMPDTFKALRAWIKAVGDPKRASKMLRAVVAQRLVRKLCPTCRVAYAPDPDQLRKLNLPPERISQLYKESGQVMVKDKPQTCPACVGMGFRGRTGVFETMVLDEKARALVAAGQLEELRAHLRRQKMLLLQEAALAKVVEGVTSIGEVKRAMGG